MRLLLTLVLLALAVVAGGWGIFLFIAGAYSCASLLLEGRPVRRRDAKRAIDEAVAECQRTGLTGWPLVEHAQQLVANRMPHYGFDNGFDFPARAFARGRGYCWQRSGALKMILERLHVPVDRVYAFRNRFPDLDVDGHRVRSLVIGHTWLRVSLDGEIRDVCPDRPDNIPGRVHFKSLSRVRTWGPGIALISYLGCPIANLFAFVACRLRGW